jgi:DNA replication protein DnaC
VKAWHDGMQDPTLADAILDRVVHNAYKLELKGESMRRRRTTLDQKTGIRSQGMNFCWRH